MLIAIVAIIHVFIAQFAKGGEYSEVHAFGRFDDLVTLKQYGSGSFIHGEPAEEDIRAARNALSEIREILHSGKYKVVILDEANIATYFELISVEDLTTIIDHKPEDVELVITGRNADPKVIEKADLVTEMREVKHYYTEGVPARDGIES